MTVKKRKIFNFFEIYYNSQENIHIPYFKPQFNDFETLFPNGFKITNIMSNNQKELEDILITIDEKLLSFFDELTKNNFSDLNLVKVKEINLYPINSAYTVYLNCPFLHLDFLNFSVKEDAEILSINLNSFLKSCLDYFAMRHN